MVAAQVEDGYVCCSDCGVEFAEEGCGLVMIGRVVYAVPVEYHKVVWNIADVAVQGLQGLRLFVQVVEDNCGKSASVFGREGK